MIVFGLACILLMIFAMLPTCGIGFVVAWPILTISTGLMYEGLRAHEAGEA